MINNKYIESLFFSTIFLLSCIHFYNFNSSLADFGFIVSNIYKLKSSWEVVFTEGHVQPVFYFLNILNLLNDGNYISYSLIFINSLSIYIGYKLIFNYYGKNLSYLYLLYTPIWILSILDFHLEIILIPIEIYLFTYYNKIKKGKILIFTSLMVIICGTKEVYAIQGILICLYFAYHERINAKYYILICFLIILYLVICYIYIFPYYSGNISPVRAESFSFRFNSDLLVYKIKVIIVYIFPLIFVLRLKLILICIIPFIGILLLSNNANYSSYNTHYFIGIIGPLFASLNYNNKRFKYQIFLSILVLFTLSPAPLSRLFLNNKVDVWGFNSYIINDRDIIINNYIKSKFSNDRNSIISIQNSINNGYLSYRKWPLPFPLGVNEKFTPRASPFMKYNSQIIADYVIVDLAKSLFIIDKGCDFKYGKCTNNQIYNEFYDNLRRLEQNYNKVFEYSKFIVYQKR